MRLRLLSALVIGAFIVYRLWLSPSPAPSWLPLPIGEGTAAYRTNSTLGFGRIYVVSKKDSPRRSGLLQAANVTELQLTIPVQPQWTDQDLKGHPNIGRGSLLAWLGHLHTLREFLDSGAETALVLEDDVDWDIHLRSLQVPRVATAVRTLLSSKSKPPVHSSSKAKIEYDDQVTRYPYGDPALWDLLYLGHCGDYWHGMDIGFEDGHVKPDDLAGRPHVSFRDWSLPNFENLHPWTASLLRNLGVPVHTRLVHRSVFPLCTFAYAITRESARRLVYELASLQPAEHKAFDIAILIACRNHGLRCWTVNPELFHHLPGTSIIGVLEHNNSTPPVDAMGQEQMEMRGETPNIGCGFWSGDFDFGEDMERLAYLRQEVGRKGQCLKEWRDSSTGE